MQIIYSRLNADDWVLIIELVSSQVSKRFSLLEAIRYQDNVEGIKPGTVL